MGAESENNIADRRPVSFTVLRDVMTTRDVLFDVDGVLVEPWRFRDFLAREHGISPAKTRAFFAGPFQKCVVGRADVAEELLPFLDEWGWSSGVSHFLECWLLEENAPKQEVLDFAFRLRESGVRCHVASTQERRRARYLAEEMRFSQYFDGLFFSCDIGAAKPNPAYFHEVARRLRQRPERLLLVDDAPANVNAARAQGWQAVLYEGPGAVKRLSETVRKFRSAQRGIATDGASPRS